MKSPLVITKMIPVVDHVATGEAMRERRVKLGISVRELARRLGYTAAFVSDLERGRRNWSEARVNEFLKHL